MFVLSNALLLSLLFLIVKSKNKKANAFLGIFLLSIAVQIFNDFIGELPIEEELGINMFIVDPFLFALPILFFYLLTTINKRIENWHYLLFIPGIIHNLLLHFYGFLLSENWLSIYEPIFYFLEILLMVYAFRILQVHKNNISDFYLAQSLGGNPSRTLGIASIHDLRDIQHSVACLFPSKWHLVFDRLFSSRLDRCFRRGSFFFRWR